MDKPRICMTCADLVTVTNKKSICMTDRDQFSEDAMTKDGFCGHWVPSKTEKESKCCGKTRIATIQDIGNRINGLPRLVEPGLSMDILTATIWWNQALSAVVKEIEDMIEESNYEKD